MDSEFDYRSYGYSNFRAFCKSLNGYELHYHKDGQTISIKSKE
ncbi:OST-HTH/LOTUS domain-containing protein [Aggregatibacter sp. oral taxon 458]